MSIWKHTFRGVFDFRKPDCWDRIFGAVLTVRLYRRWLIRCWPVQGCFYPFCLLALIVLAVVGLFHGWKFMCLPLLLLLAGGGAVATYTPFGGGEEPTDGEVLKFSDLQRHEYVRRCGR